MNKQFSSLVILSDVNDCSLDLSLDLVRMSLTESQAGVVFQFLAVS
jgi:hypothetical protein